MEALVFIIAGILVLAAIIKFSHKQEDHLINEETIASGSRAPKDYREAARLKRENGRLKALIFILLILGTVFYNLPKSAEISPDEPNPSQGSKPGKLQDSLYNDPPRRISHPSLKKTDQ